MITSAATEQMLRFFFFCFALHRCFFIGRQSQLIRWLRLYDFVAKPQQTADYSTLSCSRCRAYTTADGRHPVRHTKAARPGISRGLHKQIAHLAEKFTASRTSYCPYYGSRPGHNFFNLAEV
jgi:hypothetical protein